LILEPETWKMRAGWAWCPLVGKRGLVALLQAIEFEADTDDGVVRLLVKGELDILTARELRARLCHLKAEKIRVRLDLSLLEFMDLAGARLLRRATDEACRERWLDVDPYLQPQVRRVFDLLAARSPG
jgi:anti-anti-sigma factor